MPGKAFVAPAVRPLALALVLLSHHSEACAEGWFDALQPRATADARLRYEGADDAAQTARADALTLRLRAGLELQLGDRVSTFGEVEGVVAIVDDFDDGAGAPTGQTVVGDPETIELNQLYATVELYDGVEATLGRQQLSFDDERFVGIVDFRQNQQTYDAVRLSIEPSRGVFVEAVYLGRTNRIFGPSSDIGRFEGASALLNISAPSPIGRVTAFYYGLDLETGPDAARDDTASSQTYGARLDGRRDAPWGGVFWEASYARQTEFADNPIDYAAEYWSAGLRGEFGRASLAFRTETLGAGDGFAFQTPLGTLHAFQGDADVFLVTPPDGVIDHSAAFGWRFGAVGPVRGVSVSARRHWFSSEAGDITYGAEWDFGVRGALFGAGVSVAYAAYEADGFADDVDRLFVTVERRF